MPELPEVQTVVNQLQKSLAGRTIRAVEIYDQRLTAPQQIRNCSIQRVYRLGKRIVLELRSAAGSSRYIAVHLRMTGRLVWSKGSSAASRPIGSSNGANKQQWKDLPLRARFVCNGGSLLFLDTRRFGTIEFSRSEAVFAGPGYDPLSGEFSPEQLSRLLAGGKGNIKSWLLRQDKISGIGNIYASEILFDAAISPLRAAGSLSKAEAVRLHRSTIKILKRAILNCGTTFSDFQDAHGVTGSYQRYLKVYLREGLRCRRCKGEVLRFVQQQRSTFYCKDCQK